MAIVTPRRSGSVNFVITQDIANVPTEIKISKVETIYKGSLFVDVSNMNVSKLTSIEGWCNSLIAG